MSYKIEGVWVPMDGLTHLGKNYDPFVAFLPTMDNYEHNILLFINKNDVSQEEKVPASEKRPEGTTKIYLKPGVKILRQTITIFQLKEQTDEAIPGIWAENVEIPVTLMALPAS